LDGSEAATALGARLPGLRRDVGVACPLAGRRDALRADADAAAAAVAALADDAGGAERGAGGVEAALYRRFASLYAAASPSFDGSVSAFLLASLYARFS
jgi:hypothetical protein